MTLSNYLYSSNINKSDFRAPFSLWIARLLFALSTATAIPAALRGNTLLSGLRSVGAETIGEK